MQNTVHNYGVGLIHHDQGGYHIEKQVFAEVTTIASLRGLNVDAVKFQNSEKNDTDPVLDLRNNLWHIFRIHFFHILDASLDVFRVSLEKYSVKVVH